MKDVGGVVGISSKEHVPRFDPELRLRGLAISMRTALELSCCCENCPFKRRLLCFGKSFMSMEPNFKWVTGYVACRAHLSPSHRPASCSPPWSAGSCCTHFCAPFRGSSGIYCVCVRVSVCSFSDTTWMLYVLFQTLHVSGAILKYHPLWRQSFDPVCFQTICKVPLHYGILMSSELEMVLANSDPSV